jgi:hypothetical protein
MASPPRRRREGRAASCVDPQPGHDPGTGSGGPPLGLDPSHQPTQLAHRPSSRSASVGWSNVGLHHGGVHPQLGPRSSLSWASLATSAAFSWPITSGPPRPTSLTSVVGCGTGRSSPRRQNRRHPIESPTPPAQALVAELLAVLEVQQPQQRVDRDRRAARRRSNSARHGAMNRSSSSRRRSGPARRAAAWPARAAAPPTRSGCLRVGLAQHHPPPAKSVTTMSFTHESDPDCRRFRSSTALLQPPKFRGKEN